MNKFLTLTEAQRRTVFEQTAIRIKLPVASIEKDFWVTEILNILYSLPYADRMVFKGALPSVRYGVLFAGFRRI